MEGKEGIILLDPKAEKKLKKMFKKHIHKEKIFKRIINKFKR